MDNPENFQRIRTVLEKQFALNRTTGKYAFSFPTELIPTSLIDTDIPADDEGYSFWKPIESMVSDTEIMELEKYLQAELPESYKYFLKQYYFIDLYLGSSCRFFDNKPGELVSEYKKVIDTFYPFSISRQIIPFAHYYDWGVVAFIITKESKNLEYRIGILDREDGYENIDFIKENFLGLFAKINEGIDQRTEYLKANRSGNA